MNLTKPAVVTATAAAALLLHTWRPAWWYQQNATRFNAQVTGDHAALSFAEPGAENVLASQIRIANVAPGQWVWHTTVGYPHDPDAAGSAFAGVLGVRVVECVQGMAGSRDDAKTQAFIHLGVKIGPYLPEPETQE